MKNYFYYKHKLPEAKGYKGSFLFHPEIMAKKNI